MIIKIKVKPRSSEQKIIKISEKEYLVYLKAPPENNKANIELITLVAKYFKVPSSNVRIKAGMISRKKLVEVKV